MVPHLFANTCLLSNIGPGTTFPSSRCPLLSCPPDKCCLLFPNHTSHPCFHTPAVFICICNSLFLLILTSFGSHEQQRLRKGSFALAVKHAHSQVIERVWPEIADQLLLLAGPGLHHDCAFWLPGPSGLVVDPGALSGQVDLEPQHDLRAQTFQTGLCRDHCLTFSFCG